MKTDGLTPQQLRVARLVAQGHNNAVIATTLGIEEQTVRFHVGRIAKTWDIHGNVNIRVLIANRAQKAAA